MQIKIIRSIFAALITILFSCLAHSAEKVTVFAAASLTNVLNQIVTQYQQTHPDQIITVYASSSTLARQIVQGAPADIFISADQQWMDYIAQHQHIVPTSRQILLGNQLVLIEPLASQHKTFSIQSINDWLDRLQQQRLAVADPDHVPAGKYAKQALEYLAHWSALSTQLARSDNVRSALLLVERGEAPLGIVYASDAQASRKVRIVSLFPEGSYLPIEYPIAIVKGRESDAISQFYQYLTSPQAKVIFQQYGFTTP